MGFKTDTYIYACKYVMQRYMYIWCYLKCVFTYYYLLCVEVSV